MVGRGYKSQGMFTNFADVFMCFSPGKSAPCSEPVCAELVLAEEVYRMTYSPIKDSMFPRVGSLDLGLGGCKGRGRDAFDGRNSALGKFVRL